MRYKPYIPGIVTEIKIDPVNEQKYWTIRITTNEDPNPDLIRFWIGQRVSVVLEPEEGKL